MKVYGLDKARGRSIIEIDGGLLWSTKSLEKWGAIRYGQPLPSDFGGLNARIFFKSDSPYPLPEIARSRIIETFSESARDLVDSFPELNISWIPLSIVGAARQAVDVDWKPCTVEESGIEVNGRYFTPHLNEYADVLDVNRTLMSREYILDPAIPPGNYLRLVFRKDRELPPLFVLPGGTFGILASESLFKAARKRKISGVGRRVYFDLTKPLESDTLETIDKSHIVSMKEAWEIFEELPKGGM